MVAFLQYKKDTINIHFIFPRSKAYFPGENKHPCATASFRDKFSREINFETSKKVEGSDHESYLDISLKVSMWKGLTNKTASHKSAN